MVMGNFIDHKGQRVRESDEACGYFLPYESSRASRGSGANEARRARNDISRVLRPPSAGAREEALDWVTLWASTLTIPFASKKVGRS